MRLRCLRHYATISFARLFQVRSVVELDPQVISDFESQLNQVKERLLAMGGEAEEQVRVSVRALVGRDRECAEQLLLSDDGINQMHVEIDKRCYELLSSQHPRVEDVRCIVSGIKISAELERIGDLAVNIGEATIRYLENAPVKPLIDIPKMAEIAQGMLRDALNAYVRQSTSIAKDVLVRDDLVDGLKDKVFRELLSNISTKPTNIEPAIDLIMISRHLERIGDHATNIAEEVIFMVAGRDVRHNLGGATVS